MRIKTDPTPHPKLADPVALRRAQGTPSQGGAPGEVKQVAASSDSVKVTLSAKARELAATSEADSDFDQAKVERLRASIDRGDFKIDAQAIAQKIVED
ncbi:MAG: flagellar biosynthesis anti-sigma factor FlgM [Myxococcales bacterium]|nr:flagellar biosynthesis anti-sigma factor FlgM [Myxococcales bacterium]